MKIQDLTVLITGGCSGLGLATAVLLVSKGAKVALVDWNSENGEESIKKLGPKVAKFYEADIRKEEEVQRAFKAAFKDFGEIRAFVNCAGIAHYQKLVDGEKGHKISTFQRIMDVNLTGTFLSCKYAALHLKDLPQIGKERGVIINIASIYGKMGMSGTAAYSASKAGVLGLIIPMARDLGRFKIRVVGVSPAIIRTPMTDPFPEKAMKIFENETASKQLPDPSDFANLVKGIIENEFLNATTIEFWGGLVIPNL